MLGRRERHRRRARGVGRLVNIPIKPWAVVPAFFATGVLRQSAGPFHLAKQSLASRDLAECAKRRAAAPALPRRPAASGRADLAPAQDDEEERRVRLLLLGKAAVLAHRYERPLAAEMDETEQWRSGTADGELRYRNARQAAVVLSGLALKGNCRAVAARDLSSLPDGSARSVVGAERWTDVDLSVCLEDSGQLFS
jgi:hypothetical protein